MDVRIKEFSSSYDPALISIVFPLWTLLIDFIFTARMPAPPTCRGKWNHNPGPPWSCTIQRILMLKMKGGHKAEITNLARTSANHSSRWYVNWARMGVKLPVGCMVVVAGYCIIILVCGVRRVRWIRPYCGTWPVANAWLCQHLWDRFFRW